MTPRWIHVSAALLLLAIGGCSTAQGLVSAPSFIQLPHKSLVQRIHPSVQDLMPPGISETHTHIVAAHDSIDALPGRFKHGLIVQPLRNPWDGLARIENRSLLAAQVVQRNGSNLQAVVGVLDAGWRHPANLDNPVPLPSGQSSHDLLDFMVKSLEQAARYRNNALAALTESDRRFLFNQGAVLAEEFTPQISRSTKETIDSIDTTAQFVELCEARLDYGALAAAAQVLASLADHQWMHHLTTAFPTPIPSTEIPSGIMGDVMLVRHTSQGLIVIGGPGPNTYELDQRFALVIDLGGDDLYRGLIGASGDEDHGNTVVIDLSGDDRYEAAPLGLATGRLGVGLVVDYAGNDVYQIRSGGGGVAFAGLGLLLDAQGDDVYLGERFTQGAAIGGLGLLVDLNGNDRYISHGFALGFGGPLGIGASIDAAGDDHYQCINGLPSAYNASEAPHAKPGDPAFQYDCFGLGTGAGYRVLAKQPGQRALSLAGGWGLLLDMEGHDRYHSANFSQGMGYFFGAGSLLDLDGDDDYHAARYGQGASAHYGVGLLLDYQGKDRYRSTGPYYNMGVSWDHGVSIAIDGGDSGDLYAFEQSTGLGKADYTGWAIFVDEGGPDHYAIQSGLGEATESSLAGFFDLDGIDTYSLSPSPLHVQFQNTATVPRAAGGLFVDR